MSRTAGLRHGCHGTAAIEFAFLAIPFFALIFGTIEYARLLWASQALQETATAAARCMAIGQSSCSSNGTFSASKTQTYIQQTAAQWGLTIPTANIALSSSATCGGVTGYSQATLSYTFNSVVPALVLLPAGGKSLSASACFPNNPSSP
jgi:Flp pilus assembly protein TadG